MFHQGVAFSVMSLFALAASGGCQARTTSPLSPSSVMGSEGGVPQSRPPIQLIQAATFTNLVTSSVQVPFAYRVYFDAGAEWVDLSGKLHIVTQTRFLRDCLVPNTCLSVDIHANVSGIGGFG